MWQHKILSLGFVCTLCTSFAVGNGTPKGHQDEKKRLGTIEMAPIDAKKGRDYKSVQ